MSEENSPGSDYLRIDEAASLLGVNRRTVYRWVWKGQLPASKIGGLYFIHRQELEKRLGERQPIETEDEQEKKIITKCSICSRLLKTKEDKKQQCAFPGCEQLICADCTRQGERFCKAHKPALEERLQQAEERFLEGELDLFIRASTMRLREINFINRLRERITQIRSIIDPLSGEVLTILDWEKYLNQRDQRGEVMRLLGKVFLNGDTLARMPVNESLHFHLPARPGSEGRDLEIKILTLSDLKTAVKDGYVTHPLGEEALLEQLSGAHEAARTRQRFQMLVLASTSGWDVEARQIITGKGAASDEGPLRIPNALIYLYDLEQGELIYNRSDDRTVLYADMFIPVLQAEEVVEAVRSLEDILVVYDSITLDNAAEELPYPKPILEQAFEKLAKSGKYSLYESPDFGKGIIKS